jgi:chaperonin cofactor prefoldin
MKSCQALISHHIIFGVHLKVSMINFPKEIRTCLEKRLKLQEQISDWHIKNRNLEFNIEEYKKFLFEIGYLSSKK